MTEPDEKLVELVARAIADSMHALTALYGLPRASFVEQYWRDYQDQARAVLALPLLVAARELAASVDRLNTVIASHHPGDEIKHEIRLADADFAVQLARYRAERAKLEALEP